MNLLEFSRLILLSKEKSEVLKHLATLVNNLDDNIDISQLESFIKSIEEEEFTFFWG